jgi:hypothetical protein
MKKKILKKKPYHRYKEYDRIQAIKMGRRGIGIELKESYFELAKKNIQSALESKKQISLLEVL